MRHRLTSRCVPRNSPPPHAQPLADPGIRPALRLAVRLGHPGRPRRHRRGHRDPAAGPTGRRRPGGQPGSGRPVADRRARAGVRSGRGAAELLPAVGPVLLGAEHGNHAAQRPLPAPAAAAGELPRRLAVRPIAVPRDDRPERDPPVPVVRADLPRDQLRHVRHRARAAAVPVLAVGARRRGQRRPAVLDQPDLHQALQRDRPGRCRTSRAIWPPSWRSRPAGSGSSRRSGAATTWPRSSTPAARLVHDTGVGKTEIDRDRLAPVRPGALAHAGDRGRRRRDRRVRAATSRSGRWSRSSRCSSCSSGRSTRWATSSPTRRRP